MKVYNFKGAFLEFLVRKLLRNCGFASVAADQIYTYENNGLFYINGKGAAHDADVIMEPPIQLPFTYPSRMIFECKAYNHKVGLAILRNALGLRYDINEFEIVTKDSISQRINNNRSNYAIENRSRFNYQVGVASLNGFSKPAIEFAANNKIPLLSFSWFLSPTSIESLNSIDQILLDQINGALRDKIHKYLKDRDPNADFKSAHSDAISILYDFPGIPETLQEIDTVAKSSFFAINEAGDLFYLYSTLNTDTNLYTELRKSVKLNARIHYFPDEQNKWILSISKDLMFKNKVDFKFFVPHRIMKYWEKFSFDKSAALAIKKQFFSRIFIFDNYEERDVPFLVVNIDKPWLESF